MIEVHRVGLACTVQDLGRPGLAHLGVTRSGAADTASLRLANRLVDNEDSCAGLEVTMLGAVFGFRDTRWVAVTGAECPIWIDDEPVETFRPFRVRAGSRLRLGSAKRGVRAYLAVAGGIAVPPVLGSRSTDTLSGLGPAPLRKGDLLPLGRPASEPALGLSHGPQTPATPSAPMPEPAASPDQRPIAGPAVRLLLGPRHDRLTPQALTRLESSAYEVTTASDRIGVRLHGPELTCTNHDELPSEGIVLGAVQLPPSGQPLVFLADHPTTGGYPVIAVVYPEDVRLMAQARPGSAIRFELQTRS